MTNQNPLITCHAEQNDIPDDLQRDRRHSALQSGPVTVLQSHCNMISLLPNMADFSGKLVSSTPCHQLQTTGLNTWLPEAHLQMNEGWPVGLQASDCEATDQEDQQAQRNLL